MIVGYTYGKAVQSLSSLLPYKLVSNTQINVTYHFKALASVYTPAFSQSATETYLTELKEMAKLSGKHLKEKKYSFEGNNVKIMNREDRRGVKEYIYVTLE